MNSLRIKMIASLVDKDAYLLDIGTDHAYLPIYLYRNDITKNIIASDISENVLQGSLNNLKKYKLDNNIKLIKSNGFDNIDSNIDTVVISGIGTNTIIDIISRAKVLPDTMILSSHNDYYELRKYMNSIGYKIDKELTFLDKNIYYVVIKYIKGHETLEEQDLLFGLSNNIVYYKYLLKYYNELYEKSQNDIYKNYIELLKTLLKES